eukprot:501689-Prorocentrum_minimum.AAC.1
MCPPCGYMPSPLVRLVPTLRVYALSPRPIGPHPAGIRPLPSRKAGAAGLTGRGAGLPSDHARDRSRGAAAAAGGCELPCVVPRAAARLLGRRPPQPPHLQAGDWPVVSIYPLFPRLIGPPVSGPSVPLAARCA